MAEEPTQDLAGKKPSKPKRKKTSGPEFFRGAQLMQANDEAPSGDFMEITETPKRLFLQALAQIPRLGRAAKAAGVTQVTTWNWRHDFSDVEFQRAFERAWKMGIERCEGELWRRGVEGMEKPVYQGGRLVGTIREYDTTAAIFMLKGAEPEKYRENLRHEHTGAGGGAIRTEQAVVIAALSVEALQAKLAQLQQSLALPAGMEAQRPAAIVIDASPEQQYAAALQQRALQPGAPKEP